MFQTETSEDQDFQTPQVMKTIIIHSSMAHDNFENPLKYKNKSKMHVYFSLCMEFEINSTDKDNNLVGVKL